MKPPNNSENLWSGKYSLVLLRSYPFTDLMKSYQSPAIRKLLCKTLTFLWEGQSFAWCSFPQYDIKWQRVHCFRSVVVPHTAQSPLTAPICALGIPSLIYFPIPSETRKWIQIFTKLTARLSISANPRCHPSWVIIGHSALLHMACT